MNGSVDRRPGACEDPRHPEGFVFVARKAHVTGAVRDHDRVAQLVTQLLRDLGTQHGVVQVPELLALRHRQSAVPCITVVPEIIRIGTEHTESAM